MVECQLRGIRREIDGLRTNANCTAKCDRKTLLSLRRIPVDQPTGRCLDPHTATKLEHQDAAKGKYAISAFSKQQEEFLLGFVKAVLTPLAEFVERRIGDFQQSIDSLTEKLQTQASWFDDSAPCSACLSSNPIYSLNPDAAEFRPSLSAFVYLRVPIALQNQLGGSCWRRIATHK